MLVDGRVFRFGGECRSSIFAGEAVPGRVVLEGRRREVRGSIAYLVEKIEEERQEETFEVEDENQPSAGLCNTILDVKMTYLSCTCSTHQ